MYDSQSADNQLRFELRTFFRSRITEFFALINYFRRKNYSNAKSFKNKFAKGLEQRICFCICGICNDRESTRHPYEFESDYLPLPHQRVCAEKSKTTTLLTGSVVEVPTTMTFKYFFQRWTVESRTQRSRPRLRTQKKKSKAKDTILSKLRSATFR